MDLTLLHVVVLIVMATTASLAQQDNACQPGSTGWVVCGSNTCHTRSRLGETNYVCECTLPNTQGFTCTVPSDNRFLETCYGASCRQGFFQSPNYPGFYPKSHKQLYLLYIPGAEEIQFSFDLPFDVERLKDELYVGKGLQFDFRQIDARNKPPEKYFFEGTQRPGPFSMKTDAVWVYFITDGSIQRNGFRLRWNVIDDMPPSVQCPGDITADVEPGSPGRTVSWQEPVAMDVDSSLPPILVSRSHVPNVSVFNAGVPTRVVYVFADDAGNRGSCTFTVSVIRLDNRPPDVQCPADIDRPIPCCPDPFYGTVVVWNEPTATDISGPVTRISRSHESGNIFLLGTTTVMYSFRDSSNNVADCSFSVTVRFEDTMAPIVQCPEDVAQVIPQGGTGAVATWDAPRVTDETGSVLMEMPSHYPGSFFPLGRTQVTYTFVDQAGNRGGCSFVVFVTSVDTSGPTVTCPGDITETVTINSPGANIQWSEPTATDVSNVAILVFQSHRSGDFFGIGTTTVTYMYQDDRGNSGSCSFDVRVNSVDGTPPNLMCPSDISQTVAFNSRGATITWLPPMITDNSGEIVSQTSTHNSGDTFTIGATTVEYTATDSAGNIGRCSFQVAIVTGDDQAPTLVCPNDINMNVGSSAQLMTVYWQPPVPSDNSGQATIIFNTHNPGDAFFTDTTTEVSYVAQDIFGNFMSCSFLVTINIVDSERPTVTCPDDITRNIPVGPGGTSVSWPEPITSDNSAGAVTFVSKSAAPGSFFPVGTTAISYVYRDSSGNEGSCSFTIFISEVDTIPPQVTCPEPITIRLDTQAIGTPVFWPDATATDSSGITRLVRQNWQSGDFFFNPSETTVTYEFADQADNRGSCSFTVSIQNVDSQAPIIMNCPSDMSSFISTGQAGTPVSWVEPTATDNSGNVMVASVTHYPSSFFPVGTTAVTYRFTDTVGNVATCTFIVVVSEVDTDPPTVTCPNAISRTTNVGSAGATIFWPEPVTRDNSGRVSLVDQTHFSGNVYPMGDTLVIYRFSDMAGNIAQCSFTITVSVVDMEPPRVSCPGNIRTTTSLGTQGTIVTWTEPTATDNSGEVILISRSLPPGSFFAIGRSEVVYVFQDPSQNTQICTFEVFVSPVDDSRPMCSPREDVISAIDIGGFGTTVNFIEPQASDNSGTVTLESQTHSPGSFFTVGQTEVCYTFVDPDNNRAVCCLMVTVNEVDNSPPQIILCPSDITQSAEVGTLPLGATVTWPQPQAIDNAGVVITQSISHNPGDFFQLGNTQVSYTFADQSGMTSQCRFTVTVQAVDTMPPEAQCPEDITRTAGLGQLTRSVFWTEPVATDNGGPVERGSSHFPGQSFPIGTTRITYTFADNANNVATCSFSITVMQVDDMNPVVTCPDNVAVTVSLNAQGRRVSWDTPSATDNSGQVFLVSNTHSPNDFFATGTTTVNYIYRDSSDNLGSCNFDIIVLEVDSEPPTVSCPQNVVQTVPFGSLNPVSVTWLEPETFDNSGYVILISRTHNPGDRFTVQGPATTVTYTYQDGSGNRATCSFTVTVMQASDIQPPSIMNCPHEKQLTIPLEQMTTDVTWETIPTATDNSGIPSIQFMSRSPGVSIFRSSSSEVLALNVPVGVTVFTATATDNSGNRAECTFTADVRQVDDVPPVVTRCPADITRTAGLGVPTLHVTWDEPLATDNGGPVNMERSNFPGQAFPIGDTRVTYHFRDLANNVATCSFLITVGQVDDMNPDVTCPDNVAVIVSLNAQGRRVSWDPPSANDNSGQVFLVSNTHSPNDFFATGTTMVTYTYRDSSNNVESCNFDVIVLEVDSEPPTVSCPQNVVQTVPFGSFNPVSVTWLEPVTFDNSGNVLLISRTHNPGDTFTVQGPATTVTYTYQDGSGNRAMCSFTVTVMQASDTQPPTFTSCPNNQELTISLEARTTDVTWNTVPRATDNSGIPNIQYRSRSPGVTIFQSGSSQILALNVPVGVTSFTATAVDSSGNSAECTFSATVRQADTVQPTITCPRNQNVDLESGGGTTTSVVFPEATAMDNSDRNPTITYTSNSPGITFFENLGDRTHVANNVGPGQTIVFVTATDDAGNTATCLFTINVSAVDTTPPVITSCPENGALQTNVGGNTGSFTVPQARATDNSGTNPTIRYSTPTPGVQINDNFVGVVFVNNVPIGLTIITVTASDAFNNMAMCTFTLTVSSNPPPTILCPPNQSSNPDPDSGVAFVTFTRAAASDDSGITPNVQYESNPPGVQFFEDNFGTMIFAANVNIGMTTIIATATDGQNNMASCTFMITIDPPPQITCPDNQFFTLQQGQNSATFPQAIATDNSGDQPTITYRSTPSVAFDDSTAGIVRAFNVQGGTTIVTVTAFDGANNRATCIFTITVSVDATPTIICPPDPPSVTIQTGMTTNVVFPAATANDDSFVTPTITYTSIPAGVTFFNNHNGNDVFASGVGVGRTIVTATATDIGNSMESCQFTLTVTVNSPPQLLCPSDPPATELLSSVGTTTSLLVPSPSATDDGGVPNLQYTTSPPGVNFLESTGNRVLATNVGVGVTTVTVTATDDANNMVTCTFVLTVNGVDDTPPDVRCPADIRQTAFLLATDAIVRWDEPTVTDNSGQATILVFSSHTSGERLPIGNTVVEYRYLDLSGNQGTCSFTVRLIMEADTVAPELVMGTCPFDVQQLIDINTAPQSVTWEFPSATDNSGETPVLRSTHNSGDAFPLGSTKVTHTFCDSSNNCNSVCNFMIFLHEETPVIRNCPNGERLVIPADQFNGIAGFAEYGPISSTGNQGIQSHGYDGDLFQVSMTQRTRFSFCNNEEVCVECSFEVDVYDEETRPADTTKPTILNCPEDITRTVSPVSSSVFQSWRAPTASDPSGIRSALNNQDYETQKTVDIGMSVLVEYSFTDAVGNTDYCAFSISVSTTNGPTVFNCPDDITRQTIGTQPVPVSWVEPFSPAGPYTSRSHNPGFLFPLGNTIVLYVFRSGSAVTVCDFIILVEN